MAPKRLMKLMKGENSHLWLERNKMTFKVFRKIENL